MDEMAGPGADPVAGQARHAWAPAWALHLVEAWTASPLAWVVTAAIISRLLYGLAATLGAASLDVLPPEAWNRGPAWLHGFVRWDSGYYLDIAAQGYVGKEQLWAFHPAYPLTIAGLARALPWLTLEEIGFWVSNAAFLAAVPAFYALSRRVWGEAVAWRAGVLAAAFPSSFFFGAVYPESLFFLVVVLFSRACLGRNWWAAGGLAWLGQALRPHGVFLVPALLAAAAWDARATGRRTLLHGAGASALAATFPLVHSAYAWRVTGDPLKWVHVREEHWPQVGWHDPFSTLLRAMDHWEDNFGLPALALAMLLATTVFVWRDLRRGVRPGVVAPYAFTAIVVMVHLVYADPASLLRYALPVLPVYWMMAAWTRRPFAFAAVLAANAAVGIALSALFGAWRQVI